MKKAHKGLSWASSFLEDDFCIVGDLFHLKIGFDIFSLLYTKYSRLSIKSCLSSVIDSNPAVFPRSEQGSAPELQQWKNLISFLVEEKRHCWFLCACWYEEHCGCFMLWGKRSHKGEERTFLFPLGWIVFWNELCIYLNSCFNDVLSIVETCGKKHISLCVFEPTLNSI